MAELSHSDHTKQIFADLRRHHLRHPGSVCARVVKLCYLPTATMDQVTTARLEWLKLGLDKTKAVKP